MFDPCAVIPVFNHEHAVGGVVRGIRRHGLPCIVVDDGSGPACARVLDEVAAADDRVVLMRLPMNSGKGAAVTAGLRAAAARGYTHALQVDADGQHDLADVPRFIDAARRFPDSVICGRPVFDESMPSLRRYGRYLTHAMVWVNTLSLDIPDAMCGYRVYPLADVLRLADAGRLGARMDFDTEVLVRLYWQGQPMRWIDTRVAYPAGGVSHFRLWRDNLRITAMHTRLFFGMLIRVPHLLGRKSR